jgi:benzoyl-CoA reductase subunit C
LIFVVIICFNAFTWKFSFHNTVDKEKPEMEKITDLTNIPADPYVYCRKYKEETGKKIIGYTCSYTPEEMIYAAGALPFRLFGANEGIHLADANLQSYCCSLVRGILEEALSGRLDFLDGAVFPHTCDSFQRLSDIWRINIAHQFHVDLVLPVKLNTESARQYMMDVLEKFKKDLERALGVKITDAMLSDAIKTYNQIRALMMRLYALRAKNPEIISGRDFHSIIKAAMIMDRKLFLKALGEIAARMERASDQKIISGNKRLVLAGSVCSHPDIYDIIENAGGVVVGDDLCTGSRYFEGVLDEKTSPMEAIANRYLDRPICPAKHNGLMDRGENIVRMVRESKADGVVFLLLKFCDPHAFDYPYIKEMLDRENIPCMLLDMEEQLPSEGQLQTRFETFVQIL